MRAPTPIIEISPPHKNPPLETPEQCSQESGMSKRPIRGKSVLLKMGRCLSILFCMWLSDALSSKRITKPCLEPIQTILPTIPNRTGKRSNRTQSVLRQDMFPFLDRGAHRKNSLQIGMVPFKFQSVHETALGQWLMKGGPGPPGIRNSSILEYNWRKIKGQHG